MTVGQLKEALRLCKIPDGAEVVVHQDSNSRDYEVIDITGASLDSRYFGVPAPTSTEPDCLVLDIY